MVFQILNKAELCDYYSLNQNPGVSRKLPNRPDKFAYLDEEIITLQLIRYQDNNQVHLNFYLPQIHCSSCLYLLENLRKIDPGVISSTVHFIEKEAAIIFNPSQTTVRKVVETLASIGYEPYISLNDLSAQKPKKDKSLIFQLGVAGFCFGNIMLLSFPEYLGIDVKDQYLQSAFRWLSLFLSLPVVFYAALPFYRSAWSGIKHKYLNIDFPIAIAILATFIRSLYEVVYANEGGFFDSLAGIVFFMLAGRVLQETTYRRLTFNRDYKSYFPIAVTVIKNNKKFPTALPEIKPGDTILIHHDEIIPVDGILTRGSAFIDYSFVSGESLPVRKEIGELLYAGGKQSSGAIEILVIKEVSQGYLTRLWNKNREEKEHSGSPFFVNFLARFFSVILLGIASLTAIYWYYHNPARIWPAVTAIFIIACPCALLLANSFTSGHFLRIFGQNNIYLRNASVIDSIRKTTHLVFDKTGTITDSSRFEISWHGRPLSELQKSKIASLVSQSSHPLSRAIYELHKPCSSLIPQNFIEQTGFGISGRFEHEIWNIGSLSFTEYRGRSSEGTNVFIVVNGQSLGYFHFNNSYRAHILDTMAALKKNFNISLLSGDNDAEKNYLRKKLGHQITLLFNQSPEDKLQYIESLRLQGAEVMMIGDGLNDAGALKRANTGIAICESINNFTPSSDVIMEASALSGLHRIISFAEKSRRVVLLSFGISLLYNIVGMYFAIQGILSPLIAAILMPISTISIVLITFFTSSWYGKRLR